MSVKTRVTVEAPPHANAAAHRAFVASIKRMSSAEVVETARQAGIYDANGKLTPEFGGDKK